MLRRHFLKHHVLTKRYTATPKGCGPVTKSFWGEQGRMARGKNPARAVCYLLKAVIAFVKYACSSFKPCF